MKDRRFSLFPFLSLAPMVVCKNFPFSFVPWGFSFVCDERCRFKHLKLKKKVWCSKFLLLAVLMSEKQPVTFSFFSFSNNSLFLTHFSSLKVLEKYIHRVFASKLSAGVDYYLKEMKWNDETILHLQFCDIAGLFLFCEMKVEKKEARSK